MILSRYTIHNLPAGAVQVPDEELFLLPEKVLQFGTGALLRGGPDEWIDQANKTGTFNGRVVAVDASQQMAAVFEKQDCLFTVRRTDAIQHRVNYRINAAISRVLPAREEWPQVLECAHNPEIKLILSHSASEDFDVLNDDVRLHPPKTFAGQMLSFLFERYKAFGGSAQSGMVIIATEPFADNGRRLEAAVFELAHLNSLEDGFIEWLECCNHFCNSQVEVMVTMEDEKVAMAELTETLGYTDPLLVAAGENRSWIIEGDESVKKIVSFALAAEGVSVASGFGDHILTIPAEAINQIIST